jgi:hypothetical protein
MPNKNVFTRIINIRSSKCTQKDVRAPTGQTPPCAVPDRDVVVAGGDAGERVDPEGCVAGPPGGAGASHRGGLDGFAGFGLTFEGLAVLRMGARGDEEEDQASG